ncbi:MAG: hypothetical protein JWR26_3406 [Pedosphaera sp.]|nr:hypothetical protein [Pedosphaera sp.]
MISTTKRPSLIPLSLVGAFAFFAILWVLDFPKPWIDDLFYCGAALNLAGGGDFSNPLLARQEFPSHFYFVHPPFYTYALSGWFKIFGISAASATGFQIVLYLVIAAATIAILRRHKAPGWLEWVVPLGVSAALLPEGLRYEALSVALTMAGFALIECGFTGGVSVFAAFLLMFLGGATAPRMTVFSAVFVLLAAYRLWRLRQGSAAAGWRRWSFCIPVAAALVVVCAAFLWLIDFRVGEFWTTFHYHMKGATARSGGGKLKLIVFYLHQYKHNQWPLLLLPAGLLAFALRKPKDELATIGLVIAAAFPVVTLIGGLGRGALWYIVLMAFVLTASLVRRMPRFGAAAISAALCIVLLASSKDDLFEAVGLAIGKIKTDQGEQRAAALALNPTSGKTIVVDSVAARYLYDYRLPPGSINFEFASRFPDWLVIDSPLRNGDIYMVGHNGAEILRKETLLEGSRPITRWMLFGSQRWSADEYPCHVYMISAQECKGLRTAGSRLQ